MTKLNCSVTHCASNQDGCCCRPQIQVSGSEACKCQETCCSSFSKIEEGASNAMDYSYTNPICDISCGVKNCIHYQDQKCMAEAIQVSGAGSCCKKETECDTFKCR